MNRLAVPIGYFTFNSIDGVFKLDMIFKTLIWMPILFLVLVLDAYGQTVIIKGDSLERPVSIELNFSKSDSLLISTSQYNADYVLTVKDLYQNRGVVKIVDIPAERGHDEVLFVEKSDCGNCVLELSASSYVDAHSPFSLSVATFEELSISSEQKDIAMKFFRDYTTIMEAIFESKGLVSRSGHEQRIEAVSLLESLVGTKVSRELEPFRLIALGLLSDIYDHMGSESAFESTTLLLLDATKSKFESVRGYGLIALAATQESYLRQLEIYDEAIYLADHKGDTRLLSAAFNRKAISLVRLGRFSEAEGILLRALEINRRELRFKSVIKNLANLSWVNQRANKFPKAIQYAADSKLVAEQFEQDVDVLWGLYHLGVTYGKLGERASANLFLETALERAKSFDSNEQSSAASLIGFISQELADRFAEYERFDEALVYARQMKTTFAEQKNFSSMADAFSLIGEIAVKQGNSALADESFDRAFRLYRKSNSNRDLGGFYLKYAQYRLATLDYLGASKSVVKSLDLLSKTDDQSSLAKALSLSVWVLTELDGAKKAVEVSRRIQKIVSDNLEQTELAEYWYRDALALLAVGDRDGALASLNLARVKIEKSLPRIKRRDLRRTYLSLQKKIFEKSVEATIENGVEGARSALSLVESFKAKTLQERLLTDFSLSLLSSKQVIERDRIHKELLDFALQFNKASESERPRILNASRKLSRSLASLEQKIFDQRASLKPKRDLVLADFNVDKSRPGELTLVYFTGEQKSWVWSIHDNNLNVHELAPKYQIDKQVEEYLRTYSVPPESRLGVSVGEQQRIGGVLSDSILGPVRSKIELGNIDRLLVVPDGSLFSIPFSALAIGKRKLPMMMESVSVSYAHSLAIRKLLEAKLFDASDQVKETLVFANSGSAEVSKYRFDVIPFSEIEADYIKQALVSNVKIYKGLKANKKYLMKTLNGSYSIMHFATHGLLNNHVPELSGLSFPSSDGSTSLWLVPEISTSTIMADLVFLSACETSIGSLVPGEGLIGLSRAFIEAGAKNVVGTLWKVQDKVSAELVKEFYSVEPEAKLSFSKQLQLAQKRVYQNENNNWKDPYYWAGFQLIGSG